MSADFGGVGFQRDDWDADNAADSIICFWDFNPTVMSASKPREVVPCRCILIRHGYAQASVPASTNAAQTKLMKIVE